MNRFTIGACAGALVAVLAGCTTELAQGPYGSEEERWQKNFRDNYPGYEAPRTAPPAIQDNVAPSLIEEEQARKNADANANVQSGAPSAPPAADNPPASDDPAALVDAAAERPLVKEPEAAMPPAEPKAADPESIYLVKSGDTLSGIAKQAYGDARRSDVILSANPKLKNNPNLIRSGMKLVIPKL